MDAIRIRIAKDDDAQGLLSVHRDAIRQTAFREYPPHIIEQWSRPIDTARIEEFCQNTNNELRLAAETEDGTIVGFGALVLEKNELRACYVSPAHGRRGIGRSLVAEIEKIAVGEGLEFLAFDSSLTAEKFYVSCGYRVVERGFHEMRSGDKMACVKFRKDFRSCSPA